MKDWIEKLDGFLKINERDILKHAGKISHELAEQQAIDEYNKFNPRRIAEGKDHLSDFDKSVRQIESGKSRKKDEDTSDFK